MLNLETSKDGEPANNNGFRGIVLAGLKSIATFIGKGAKYRGHFVTDIPVERHLDATATEN